MHFSRATFGGRVKERCLQVRFSDKGEAMERR